MHSSYVDCSVEFCSGVSVEGIYDDPEAKTLSVKVIEKKRSENDGLERID